MRTHHFGVRKLASVLVDVVEYSHFMRPKDLKYPFIQRERSVLLQDRVMYVPERIETPDFVFPSWDHPDLFSNNNPVHIEYCSGNGAWILEKALSNPHINWIAIEMKFDRVRKIWSKIKNHDLKNLFVICGEGLEVTRRYFIDASIDAIAINFPDPWPKTRHAKNRIVNPRFVVELRRILKENGELILVTDDLDYSKEMIKVMKGSEGFMPLYPEHHVVSHIEGYGTSYFEELWRAQGKEICYHPYKKQKDSQ